MKTVMFVALVGFFLHDTTAVMHSYQYFYTASSEVPNFPEFVGVGMVDDYQVGYYDSNTKRAEPKQDWANRMTEDEPQFWEGQTGRGLRHQHELKFHLDNIKQRFNQTGGVHIFQLMQGCEWDDETGEVNGYEQFGYDGEDFLVLDLKTMTWIAPQQQAVNTKQEWNQDKAELEYVKYFLNKECIDWLKKLVNFGRSSLMRTDLPTVSLLQKTPSSRVTCHATGFYPARAVIFWRKDGEELHEDVDHGEILPNHDGSFQMSVDLELPSDDWGKYECVFQLSGVKEDIVTKLDKREIKTNYGNPLIMTIVIIAGVLLLVTIVCAAGFCLLKKRNAKRPPSPVNGPAVDINTQRRDNFIKNIKVETFPKLKTSQVTMKTLMFVALVGFFLHDTTAVMHSMRFFSTMSSEVPNFPEFVVVAMVDDIQVQYYDSNTKRAEPKQDWANRITEDEPHYWEWLTQRGLFYQQRLKFNLDDLKQRFNQTGGVHIFQNMDGCEWDDETGEVNGYDQFGYDGEDFIVLDLKTMTWIAPQQQAVITKQEWDQDKARLEFVKYYHTTECIDWLKKFVNYGRSVLMRTDLPTVSLLQKTPSSRVTCHATGFYPARAVMFWRKDGEELDEDVDHGEILPNHDGSFQMSVDLELPSDDWGRYDCVFQLSGVKEDIVTKLDKREIKTNYVNPRHRHAIIAIIAAVLLVLAVIGYKVYRCRTSKRDTSSENSSELAEKLNPEPK
ncbi:uncharacterized protein LKV04_015932 [Tautogolabrus adspersus]